MIKGKRGNKKRQRFAKTARCHEVKRAQTGKRRKKGEDEKREARAKKNEGKGKRKERRVVNCWPQFTCRIREIIIFSCEFSQLASRLTNVTRSLFHFNSIYDIIRLLYRIFDNKFRTFFLVKINRHSVPSEFQVIFRL